MALVTVGIPTYNRRDYLQEAIESVLAQTFGDFRLVISDNGSSDGTEEMVSDYAKTDHRLVYHRFATNFGPSANGRYLLRSAKGEFMAILPDDDLWLPDHLANAVQALQDEPDASMFCCISELFGKQSGFYRPIWLSGCAGRIVYDARKRYSPLLMGTPAAFASVVFRSKLLDGIHLYRDDSFRLSDWFLWGQLALLGAIVYDPFVRARFRWHADNDSKSFGDRKGSAEYRYVVGRLAALAVERKALDVVELVRDVLENWPTSAAVGLSVALVSPRVHPALQHAGRLIFNQLPEPSPSLRVSRHYRIAKRVGIWYLPVAAALDSLLSGWWGPGPAMVWPVEE